MESPYIAVAFDEPLNKTTQKSKVDLIIRYWNVNENKVESPYWDSSFLGHATHQDLFMHFETALEGIDVTKLVQVSIYGPTVNWLLLDLLIRRMERELPALADIGSCNLHIVLGTFNTGAEATDWEIKKTLKHDTRREESTRVTGGTQLSFCATHCIEDRRVADRLRDIWTQVVKNS